MERKKVLIIDDSEAIIMCLSILIKRLGFVVLAAKSGKAGIDLAREAQPTMIILDIRMPDMDGVETLRALKTDESTRPIPVVMHSVEGDEMKAECESLGCADYLMKPSTLAEVNRVVQRHCAPPAQGRRQCLRSSFNHYVTITHQGRRMTLFALTVSEGGIYVKTLSPLPVGSRVELDLNPRGRGPLIVEGTVIYLHDTEAGVAGIDPGMAIRFDSLSERTMANLSRLVNDLLIGDIIANQDEKVILESRFEERTRALKADNLRLKELDTVKNLFIASMSHELRTPLNAVIGFTGLLLKETAGPVNEEQRRQLTMVRQSGEHLLGLINDIIDVGRIGAGEMHPVIDSFDLVPLAGEIEESFRLEASGKNLDLRLDLPGTLAVTSDKLRVKQIAMNLVSNAVKYTESGSVVLAGRAGDNTVEFSVTDSGPGIDGENVDRLFLPFSRLHDGSDPGKPGTGLGLYLSQQIARLLGGRVDVESSPGAGSVFTLILPAPPTP